MWAGRWQTRRGVAFWWLCWMGVSYPGQLASQLGLTRSNVSNHLSCLRGCGLVVATYEGRQVRYELADVHLAYALGELVQVVLAVDDEQPCEAAPVTAPSRSGGVLR